MSRTCCRRIAFLIVGLSTATVLALNTRSVLAEDSTQYVVGPRDVLTINVLGQPQLSGKYSVEADGAFTFPLLGRVSVSGQNLESIEQIVRTRLAGGYLKDPQVIVSVDQYRSQQIFVMGEVRQPGGLPLTGPMTLVEALARVGSTTERAGTEALIVHAPEGGSTNGPAISATDEVPANVIRVNLQTLQRGALGENVALKAGDTVFVPRAETVFVTGLVRTPGEYMLRPGMTVRQALALAGGVTERGSNRRIQVIRMVDGKESHLDVSSLEEVLRPGDTIVARERFF